MVSVHNNILKRYTEPKDKVLQEDTFNTLLQ
jgi:hypothetical protein